MSFATPTAFLWAALAIPLVVFYVLKIRLRRVPVSTNLFWREIFQDKRPRSLWHYLRHLVSLFLQLVFLALLVTALAGPFLVSRAREARRLVLILDTSASMNATDVAPNRLERARQAARAVVDGLGAQDELALVVAGTRPQVLCGLTGHQRTLRHALAEVTPTDGPGCIDAAVALARRLLADQEHGQVIVVTDGCFEGAAALAAAKDVHVIGVGQRTGNVGITRFQVRRSLRDPLGYSIFVEVVNASDEPVECRLEIDLEGDPVDVVPLRLAPDEPWSKVLEASSPAGGRLVARLDRPDALAADNQAVALVPRREVRRVILVSRFNAFFLENVFNACRLVDLTTAPELPATIPPGAITVLYGAVPRTLPPGPVFVIDPQGPCDLWELGEKRPATPITKVDKDSPLMGYVALDGMQVPPARKLEVRDAVAVRRLAATLADDPVLCAFEREAGRVLVLNVNLERCELPLRTAFPILAANALSWLTGLQDEMDEALATGAVAEVALPGAVASGSAAPTGGGEIFLWGPDGRPHKLPTPGTQVTVGPLDRCGVWTVAPASADDAGKPAGPPWPAVACNLVNRRKSDLRPPAEFRPSPEWAAAGFADRPLWVYLLGAAWLLIGVEWYLYQRRWIS